MWKRRSGDLSWDSSGGQTCRLSRFKAEVIGEMRRRHSVYVINHGWSILGTHIHETEVTFVWKMVCREGVFLCVQQVRQF